MQLLLCKFAFSKFSSKNSVPRILSQGRFTRDGFKMLGTNRKSSPNFVERRFIKIQRPVDLSEVENSHLYYNHQDEVHRKLKIWKQKRITRQKLLFEAPTKEYILEMIKNEQNLSNGSWQLLFGLKLIHKHYPQEIDNNREHIDFALTRLNQFVSTLDIHNFRSLVSFAQRYLNEDKDSWFIVSHEQKQKPLLSNDVKEDVRQDFIKIYHTVVEKAFHFDLQLDSLIAQTDMMMRNHYRDIKTLVNPPSPNSIANLQGNQAALFQSDFIRVMLKRKDFYNDYDTIVKQKQVQSIIVQGQNQILANISQLSPLAMLNLKLAYVELKDTNYINKDLQEFSKKLAL